MNRYASAWNSSDSRTTVSNGYLLITAEGSDWPVYEDPFLIVGHCMIAVAGAFLGGVLAPIADPDTRPRSQPAKG